MSDLLKIKGEIYKHCMATIMEKVEMGTSQLESLEESLELELKSSAGDKFETGREMMHAEFERVKKQLVLTIKQLEVLQRINPEVNQNKVSIGSLVVTNTGKYFFSVAIGRIQIEKEKYFGISLASPIGKLLKDKVVGDKIEFNGKKITIKEIT